jgi:hypothetical protein
MDGLEAVDCHRPKRFDASDGGSARLGAIVHDCNYALTSSAAGLRRE